MPVQILVRDRVTYNFQTHSDGSISLSSPIFKNKFKGLSSGTFKAFLILLMYLILSSFVACMSSCNDYNYMQTYKWCQEEFRVVELSQTFGPTSKEISIVIALVNLILNRKYFIGLCKFPFITDAPWVTVSFGFQPCSEIIAFFLLLIGSVTRAFRIVIVALTITLFIFPDSFR